MSEKHTNVVVYVSGPVGTDEQTGIEQAIAAESGVARAVRSAKAKHLILVDYDPRSISSRRILETVRGCGVSAQLVGM